MDAGEARMQNCTHMGHLDENARNKGHEAAIMIFLTSQYENLIVESIS
jgi:hypothetical protein